MCDKFFVTDVIKVLQATVVLRGNIAIIQLPIVLLRQLVAASNFEHAQWD